MLYAIKLVFYCHEVHHEIIYKVIYCGTCPITWDLIITYYIYYYVFILWNSGIYKINYWCCLNIFTARQIFVSKIDFMKDTVEHAHFRCKNLEFNTPRSFTCVNTEYVVCIKLKVTHPISQICSVNWRCYLEKLTVITNLTSKHTFIHFV